MSLTPIPIDAVQFADETLGPGVFIGPWPAEGALYAWDTGRSGFIVFNGLNVYRSSDGGATWHIQDGAHVDSTSFFSIPHAISDRLVIPRNINQGTAHLSFRDFVFATNTFGSAYGTTGGPQSVLEARALRLSNGDTVVLYEKLSGSTVLCYWGLFSGGSWTSIDNSIASGVNLSITIGIVDASDVVHIATWDHSTNKYYRLTAGVLSSSITMPQAGGNGDSKVFSAAVIGSDLFITRTRGFNSSAHFPGVFIGSPAGSFASFSEEDADTDAADQAQYNWGYADGSDLALLWADSNSAGGSFLAGLWKTSRAAGVWSAKQQIYDCILTPPSTPILDGGPGGDQNISWISATPSGIIINLQIQSAGIGLRASPFFLWPGCPPSAPVNLNIALGGSGAGVS